MGTWGTGLYCDDDALDARDGFLDLLAQHQNIGRARRELLKRTGVSLDRPEADPAFVLGLAMTQWRNGWSDEPVRAAAIRVVETGVDLERWQAPAERRRRNRVLERILVRLESGTRAAPRPFPKRPEPRVMRLQLHDLGIGEIVSRKLPSGRVAVLKVVEISPIEEWGVVAPVVRLLKWTSEEFPLPEEAAQLVELQWLVRPDRIVAYTKLSLASPGPGEFGGLIRIGCFAEVGDVPKSGLSTSACAGRICSIDEMLEHALSRWWDDPSLPANAPPPWANRRAGS